MVSNYADILNCNHSDIIMDKLREIEKNIFDYNISGVPGDVVNLFSFIIENNATCHPDVNMLNSLNKLMAECLAAMQSCDYLLLADLLSYKLSPILGGETH
ncbi:MAG: hypothetical protein FWH52_01350 [Synergistaceae bacterium]|nr:hypothetical protein [Synergistaceae bacterium]